MKSNLVFLFFTGILFTFILKSYLFKKFLSFFGINPHWDCSTPFLALLKFHEQEIQCSIQYVGLYITSHYIVSTIRDTVGPNITNGNSCTLVLHVSRFFDCESLP